MIAEPGHDEAIRSFLADLTPEQDEALLHLLGCPSCREMALGRLFEELAPGLAPGPSRVPDYEAMWRRLEAKLPGLIAEAGRRTAEGEALFLDLMAMPAKRRAKTLQTNRFQSPWLVERLLEASHEQQLTDPAQAATLAALAASLAVRTAGAAQFLARAFNLAGNARRLLGQCADAEIAFASAAYFQDHPGEVWDRAWSCRALALLRWEEGRLDETAALLLHAIRLFGEAGLIQEQGATKALLGLLHVEQHDSRRAISPLFQGRQTLDVGRRPWLAVRAGFAFVLCLAELHQPKRARAALEETQQLAPLLAGDAAEEARALWLEGRALARLGERDEATELLDRVRRRFLDEKRLPEAAIASLDLALVLTEIAQDEPGRSDETERLTAELAQRFAATEGLDLALRSLADFARAAGEGYADLRGLAARHAAHLRNTYRFRDFRVEPLPFA